MKTLTPQNHSKDLHMNTFVKLASVGVLALGAAAAQAIPVVSLSGAGITTTSVAGATTIDFNSGCGYASCAGDYEVVSGSLSGVYAAPAGVNSPFLTVPYDNSSGSATFALGTTSDYFGLFWGSIDAYNSISFFLNGNQVASFTGTQIVGATYANGNQVNLNSNRYINFDFGNDVFDTVKFISTQRAFETDNHAYRNTASVAEPSALLLMLGGLLTLVGVRLRK